MARNLDRLSLDNEHVQRTDALRRSRPQGVTEGFTQGLTGLGISILGAVGGLAHHPLQATSPVGIVTGMGKGIVGAFTKPISGAAELLALTGQGMLQSVGYNTLPLPKALHPVGHKIEPISFKPIWAPQIPTDGNLLLTFQATLLHKGYRSILIGVYTKSFVILEIGSSQIIEILELDTIHPSIDAVDQNQVTLIIKPELPPRQLDDIFSYPVSSRTVQYVQDSLINLSVFKTGHYHFNYHHQRARHNSKVIDEEDENETANDDLQVLSSTKEDEDLDISVIPTENLDDPIEDIEGSVTRSEDDNERRLVFYMNENLAKYLVNYVNLLKRNQHSSMVFLPFEF